MGSQLTTNGDALRLFFTDEVYLIKGEEGIISDGGSVADDQYVALNSATPDVQVSSAVVSPVVPVQVPGLPVNAVEVSEVLPETKISSVADVVTIPEVELTPDFKFLGKNKRNILILVNDAENEVSDEKGRELLRKIVKSIGLTAADFALLNYAQYPESSYQQLQQYFSSELVFAFGVSAAQLKLQQHPENKIVTEGGVRLIFSAELKALEEDPTGKKVLWSSLKQLGL